MATSVKELLEQKQSLRAQATELLDRAEKDGGRAMTSEEDGEYAKIDAELSRVCGELDRINLLQERRAKLEALANAEPQSRSGVSHRENVSSDERLAAAFRDCLRFGRDASNESRELMANFRNEREKLGLYAGSGAAGGYLIPPQQFVNTLIKSVDNITFVRGVSTVMLLNKAESLGAPVLTANPSDATWTTELLTGSADSAMAFGKRELRPHPLAKRILMSNTLINQSAMPVESMVTERLAYVFGITQEQAFLTGSGNQQPLGVFTASNDGIPTSRDYSTGNTTTAVKFDGLIGAVGQLKQSYRRSPNLRWAMSRTLITALRKEKDGNGQYLWQMGTSAGEPDRVLGIPYIESEYVPTTFTTGQYVAVLGDWTYYWIADASPLMTMQRIDQTHYETNQIAYVARTMLDGAPVLSEAFVRVKLA